MVIDSSALIAILLDEPEARAMLTVIATAERRIVGAATLVESAAVLIARKGTAGDLVLDALLQRLDIEVVSMTPDAAKQARSAYLRFGKGVGNPAVLDYGDCLAYGVAASLAEPLLFKGTDFAATDIAAVAY